MLSNKNNFLVNCVFAIAMRLAIKKSEHVTSTNRPTNKPLVL